MFLTPKSTKVPSLILTYEEYTSYATFTAYEEVRSKSDVNWVLIDYEVCLFSFS